MSEDQMEEFRQSLQVIPDYPESEPPVRSSELVLPAADLEAIFCVALLNTLDTRQTQAVLTRYLAMRDDADNVLKALGRR